LIEQRHKIGLAPDRGLERDTRERQQIVGAAIQHRLVPRRNASCGQYNGFFVALASANPFANYARGAFFSPHALRRANQTALGEFTARCFASGRPSRQAMIYGTRWSTRPMRYRSGAVTPSRPFSISQRPIMRLRLLPIGLPPFRAALRPICRDRHTTSQSSKLRRPPLPEPRPCGNNGDRGFIVHPMPLCNVQQRQIRSGARLLLA
jgi:hypothetical protein